MSEEKSLQDVLIDELRDAYDAEKQLIKALGKMAKAANAEPLRAAFLEHQEQTRGQVQQLEEVFALFDLRPRGKHCPGIAGIIEEGGEVIEELPKSAVRDAALIGGGQRAEHYEIAAYGTMIAFAETLGNSDAAKIFKRILSEEEATDKKLSGLARSINQMAAEEVEMEEEVQV
jgi:ferritin-like metal-binding protein YciE